ncbi:odorant receptor 131-2-like [Rhinophrynus dorsalis]
MVNTTFLVSNITRVSMNSNKQNDIAQLILMILTLLCFCLFLYFISVLLNVYFTTPHVRENARYILFTHMLINDTLYIILALTLLLGAMFLIYMPMTICYTLLTLANSTFRITAYNLAVMSLERYIAICFPLRHLQFCSAWRSNIAIGVMWVIAIIPNVADFFALSSSVEATFFAQHVICNRTKQMINPVQTTIKLLAIIISFSLVGLIIVCTYIKVIQVAHKIGSSKSSVSKAGKTVLLHAIQLLLCMTAFISTFTETYFEDYSEYLLISNFFMFTCLPRFLSPMIYGIRDEVFRKAIRKMYTVKERSFNHRKTVPNICEATG